MVKVGVSGEWLQFCFPALTPGLIEDAIRVAQRACL